MGGVLLARRARAESAVLPSRSGVSDGAAVRRLRGAVRVARAGAVGRGAAVRGRARARGRDARHRVRGRGAQQPHLQHHQ